MAKGLQGIQQEVYVSLPCTLAENGVSAVVQISLTASESEKLHKSATELQELLGTAKL